MLNLVSGQTHGATPAVIPDSTDNGTVIGDPDGAYDDCSGSTQVSMSGQNVGDLLNNAGVSWGWFQGGFRPSAVVGGKAQCKTSHTNLGGATVTDYSAHHQPFEYYASTANPHHTPPASVAEIGHNGPANHQYDLSDFYNALNNKNLPAVTFLKAAKYQDGHAGYSDPLDEQSFLVTAINAVQQSDVWKSTAIVLAYDDSDGWYDHVMPPIVNSSASAEDALTSSGHCGNGAPLNGYQDRCGYGPRLPLLVLSPYARENFVDHAVTDQSSVLRFIEDNWSLPRIGGGSFDGIAGSINDMLDFQHSHGDGDRLILDPNTGLKH
jgi:phospholipase C